MEGPADSRAGTNRLFEPERKDFWDEFSSIGEERRAPGNGPEAIGTTALKKEASASSSSVSAGVSASSTSKAKDFDDWDDKW